MIYLLFFFIALNFFYVVGKLITDLFFYNSFAQEQNQWFKIFVSLLTGVFAAVFVYSVFVTRGTTVNLLALIPLGYIFYKNPPAWTPEKLRMKEFFNYKLNLISIPILLFQMLFFIDFTGIYLLPKDTILYGETSYFLSMGHENTYGVLNDTYLAGATIRTPYHYFELWLNALLSATFHLNHGSALLLISYPLLLVCYFAGILSIFNHLNSAVNWKMILGAYLLLFAGPVYINILMGDIVFPLYDKLFRGVLDFFNTTTIVFENTGFYNNTLAFSHYGQKHLPFYCLFALVVIMVLKRKLRLSLLVLSMVIIVNVGLLPGVYAGVGLFILFQLLFNKQSFRDWFPVMIVYVLMAGFFTIFYWVFALHATEGFSSGESMAGNTLHPFFHDLNTKGEVLRFLFRIVFAALWLTVLYLFYLLFYFFIRKKVRQHLDTHEKTVFILAFLFMSAGLVMRPFMQGFNSGQFLSYLMPAANLSIVLFLIKAFTKRKKTTLIFLCLIFCINFINLFSQNATVLKRKISDVYSQHFVKQVRQALGDNNNVKIAYLLDEETIKKNPPASWYSKMPCEFLPAMGFHNFYNINYPFISYPVTSYTMVEGRHNQLKYLKDAKSIPYDKLIIDFFDTYEVRYVAASKNTAFPLALRSRIGKNIVDGKSGEAFWVLKSQAPSE